MGDFIIKNGILEEYRGMSEEIIVPEGVTKIESWFCNEPERVKRLILPKSLIRIRDCNFIELKNLEYVFIPSTVKSVGRCAFSGCANLERVEMENKNTEVEIWAFDGTKFEADMLQNEGAYILGDTLVKVSKEVEKYEIPPCVKRIGRDSFKFSKIKKLVVPEGVTEIGICAFFQSELECISLPNSLRRIGDHAFDGCAQLRALIIPKSVSFIGDNALNNIPNCTVTMLNPEDDDEKFRISPWSFGIGQTCLKEVHAPFGSVAMRSAMLSDVRYTALPGSPRKYTYIDNVFCCKGATLVRYLGKQKIVYVPDGVDAIANNAFFDNKMARVCLPDSVTAIEDLAFAQCEQLEIITGNGVKEIKEYAFSNCKRLKKVSFPHLERYVDIAFIGCDSLKPENMFFPPDTIVVETHWRTCSCFGCKPIEGKIHANAATVLSADCVD